MNLTDREKQIVLIKYIIHGNSPFAEAPLQERVDMLKTAVGLMGLNYDEGLLMEVGQACLDFQHSFIETQKQFIKEHKDILIHAHTQLFKGNDSMIGLLGKMFTDKALDILKEGGKVK